MTDNPALDQLVEAITVDSYDVDEQMTAFHAVFTNEVSLPAEATIVGVSVQVLDVDIRASGSELTAHCRHGADHQEPSLADLVFPPQTVGAWIHAAYRRSTRSAINPHPSPSPSAGVGESEAGVPGCAFGQGRGQDWVAMSW